MRHCNTNHLVQFTSTYSSPERSNNADQRKVDVWAAGCILYELCTGMSFMRPQRGGSIYALIAQLSDPNWTPPDNCLPLCMACWHPMLNAMLCRDAAQRPLPRDLLRFDVLKYVSSVTHGNPSYHLQFAPVLESVYCNWYIAKPQCQGADAVLLIINSFQKSLDEFFRADCKSLAPPPA